MCVRVDLDRVINDDDVVDVDDAGDDTDDTDGGGGGRLRKF